MSRCILHIGMHKTGSSSIQRSLQAVLANQQDYVYPAFNDAANHSEPLFSLFTTEPELYAPHINVGRDAERIAKFNTRHRDILVQSLQDNQGKTVVLSGEDLTRLDAAGLEQLKTFLLGYVDRVEVYGYVRPPRAYMSSAYQQRLKALGKFRKRNRVENTYPNYRAIFEKIDQVFGAEQVHLRQFSSDSLLNACAVEDFFSWVDIPLAQEQVIRVNEGLSRQAASILYAYRVHGEKFGGGRLAVQTFRMMVRALRGVPGEPFRLANHMLDPVLDAQADDIAWMEARLGSRFDEVKEEPDYALQAEEDLLQMDMASMEEFFANWRRVMGRDFPNEAVDALWLDAEFLAGLIEDCGTRLTTLAEKREQADLARESA